MEQIQRKILCGLEANPGTPSRASSKSTSTIAARPGKKGLGRDRARYSNVYEYLLRVFSLKQEAKKT